MGAGDTDRALPPPPPALGTGEKPGPEGQGRFGPVTRQRVHGHALDTMILDTRILMWLVRAAECLTEVQVLIILVLGPWPMGARAVAQV